MDDDYQVWYIEKDNQGNPLPKVRFRELATGMQSIIAMVGDIILNLAENGYDKSERPIVFIDELELYLHPSWQRRLPTILSDIFPNILFIATTHSPLCLQGAPKNSAIFTMHRSAKEGITMKRYDDKIDFAQLMPNALLTSPVFNMDDITPISSDNMSLVSNKDDYKQIELDQALEAKISAFASKNPNFIGK